MLTTTATAAAATKERSLQAQAQVVVDTPGADPLSIPVLEDYDISPLTGFVPHDQPLQRLPQSYYQPWEETIDQLNHLIDNRQLRAKVNQWPVLEIGQLTTLRQRQRAYVLLGFVAHSYIWGSGLDIAQSIPEPLAIPWVAVSDLLEIAPVLTYASNDLWNWKLKDPQGPFELENLETLSTMTGTKDEDWFDIVSAAIEMAAGPALQALIDTIHAVREDNIHAVTKKLHLAHAQLDKISKLLPRMFENCDPAVFYWKIRKYLAGSEGTAGLGLFNGLEYKGVNNNERRYYMGATAGQSSVFPALDYFFGVTHHENDGQSQSAAATKKEPNALLLKMRGFMPAPHRAFLDHLSKTANLRPYVLSKTASDPENQEVQELVKIYDACVHCIKLFRDSHIQIVTRYILTQARRGPPEGWEDYRVKVDNQPSTVKGAEEKGAKEEEEGAGMKGTGGSELMPFLKGNRDETNAAKIVAVVMK
ncbi:MAG: Indoleamine 2,3-dioxygenase [Linnemannia gamsii]|nr:MAG: Indoleamine 2,3-dioxygenase [Linnemannia gamsii]